MLVTLLGGVAAQQAPTTLFWALLLLTSILSLIQVRQRSIQAMHFRVIRRGMRVLTVVVCAHTIQHLLWRPQLHTFHIYQNVWLSLQCPPANDGKGHFWAALQG